MIDQRDKAKTDPAGGVGDSGVLKLTTSENDQRGGFRSALIQDGAQLLEFTFAADVLDVGPHGFGLLRSGPAIGASAMALALAYAPLKRHAGRRIPVIRRVELWPVGRAFDLGPVVVATRSLEDTEGRLAGRYSRLRRFAAWYRLRSLAPRRWRPRRPR